MLKEEKEKEEGGERNIRSRGEGGTELLYPQVGGSQVGRALRVKTIDFKRLYMNYTVQQNKNSYEEQLLQ